MGSDPQIGLSKARALPPPSDTSTTVGGVLRKDRVPVLSSIVLVLSVLDVALRREQI